jgi:hypothetical protein
MKAYAMSSETRTELNTLVAGAANESSGTVAHERLIEKVAVLPPNAIFEVEDLVGFALALVTEQREQRAAWFRRVPVWDGRVKADHAPVLMMSKSGYVRQAALTALTYLPDTGFFVAALVWRLNDWVQQVRRAAEDCAERILPQMSAQAIVAAAPFLLERMSTWGRWGSPPEIVIRTIARPDCTAELLVQFARSAKMSAGALRAAMRLALLDDHILALSRTAVRPEFRATLLTAMLDGEVTWVTHYERQWVDKRYGIMRRIPVLGRRRLSQPESVEALIRQGAKDQSPLVRRAAASGLVKHAAVLPDIGQLMALFAADKSPSVRWRMDYLARRE